MSRRSLRASSLALAGILIAIGGCAESPTAARTSAPVHVIATPHFLRAATSTSGVIGPEGGVLQTASGNRIEFPAGALDAATTVTIADDPQFGGVTLQPHGITFPAGAQPVLTLQNDAADLSGHGSVSIGYVDESGSVYQVLDTQVLGNGRLLRASLPHFSILTVVGS